jgi:hypothetical protein
MDEQVKKQPEVELDLDDAKETSVELKEKEEPKKTPNLNVGEVDLGYTNHDNKSEKDKIDIEEIEDQPKVEVKTEEKKPVDNLEQHTESVKKRIDKLTYKIREAERREQAALEYAKGLQKKYSDAESKYMDVDTNYIKEFDARVDAQRAQAKSKLKLAIESQDAEQIATAQDELTRLSVEKEKARIVMSEREVARKSFDEQRKAQPVQQAPRQPIIPSTKAKSWAEKNEWFGNDKYMTNSAFMLHEDLVSQGFDAESDEYYNEVDKRMKDLYPHKFAKSQESEVTEENRKPVQTVASAGRKQSGRRTVKLTKSQVAIAKKLGVPLEEYAKYVKEV